ncbi:MAG TPA: AMP-binding protein [Flavobacteriales bacterium]|nr:AMP-binding protein [Flavobacteriales bacterium]
MAFANEMLMYDDNFPEIWGNVTDWIEKFNNLLSPFANRPNTRVVILCQKHTYSISMMYAARDLNIPYIPIDINSPVNRISAIIEQIDPFIVLYQKSEIDVAQLPLDNINVIWENNVVSFATVQPQSNLAHHPDLSFVLFTSGSTGIPKGVMTSRNNANCFVDWMISEFGITKQSRILSIAPLHFDLSVFDVFAAEKLKAGLFVPLVSMIVNPMYLADFIFNFKIDTLYATPTWYNLLLQYGKLRRHDFSLVKTVLIAGEALKTQTVEELHKYFPNAQFANLYGPTETNVCTFYKIDFQKPIKEKNGVVCIGKPCPYAALNTDADNILQVSGKSVMLGYWPAVQNLEWYSTGDVVEMDADGDYYFMERADRMIKRNGYRIEPAEIETAILYHPEVGHVAVTAKGKEDKMEITAHYTLKGTLQGEDLARFCLLHLPSYMVPDKFRQHEKLPLTSSGKTDYNALMNS